jgi:hypothetical protein
VISFEANRIIKAQKRSFLGFYIETAWNTTRTNAIQSPSKTEEEKAVAAQVSKPIVE